MTHLRLSRAAGAALALLLAGLAVGCGGGSGSGASVEGTVTYDGTPIDNGKIVFVPADGGAKGATGTITDGKYSIEAGHGPAPGKYKVEITWLKAAGRGKLDPDTASSAENAKQVLPDKYNKATTLTADIKSGTNKIDFPLTK